MRHHGKVELYRGTDLMTHDTFSNII